MDFTSAFRNNLKLNKYDILHDYMVDMTKDLRIYFIVLFDKYLPKSPEPYELAKLELQTLKLIFEGNKNVKLALLDWHEIEKRSKDSVFSDFKFLKYVRIVECLNVFDPFYITEFYESIVKGSSSLALYNHLKKDYPNQENLLRVINCYCLTFSLLWYKNFVTEEFKLESSNLEDPSYLLSTTKSVNEIIIENNLKGTVKSQSSIKIPSFKWQKNPKLVEILYDNLVFLESPLISPETPVIGK